MKETQFTKGPWVVNKYGGIGGGRNGIEELVIDYYGWAHDWSAEECQRHDADAHLIAAAPELFEALEWVRANYAAGSTKEINARIDAALAKARGEQP